MPELPPSLPTGERDGVSERFVPEVAGGGLMEVEHVARYRWAAALAPGRRVLDAGCGVGYGTRMLLEAGAASVVGVDRSRAALELAAAGLAASDAVSWVEADLRALPFAPGSFDLVVCFEVLEHLPDALAGVDALRGLLAPGGVLVCSTPNRGVFAEGNPHHLDELTEMELRDGLAARFAWFRLARQDPWASTTIRAVDAGQGPVAFAEPVAAAAVEDREPLYVLAVASDGPVELPPGVAVLGGMVDVRGLLDHVRDVERRSLALERALELLREQAGDAEQLRALLADVEAEAGHGRAAMAAVTALEGDAAGLRAELALAAEALEAAASEHDRLVSERDAALAARAELAAAVGARDAQLAAVRRSRSWRLLGRVRRLTGRG